MSIHERSIVPIAPSTTSVGSPSRLITRGVMQLQSHKWRCYDLRVPEDMKASCNVEFINNLGQIVGTTVKQIPVLWDQENFVVLDMILREIETRPKWTFSISGLNDSGQILSVEKAPREIPKSVLWDNGQRLELQGLYTDPYFADPYFGSSISMNNRGQVIGFHGAEITTPMGRSIDEPRAAVWDAGRITVLETLPNGQDSREWSLRSIPKGINDHGAIVGSCGRFPVIWEDGRVTSLPLPESEGYSGSADDINDRGEIVGRVWETRPHEPRMPFYGGRIVTWINTEFAELQGTGELDPRKLRINNKGQISGLIFGSFSDHEDGEYPFPDHAYIWDNGQLIRLESPKEQFCWVNDINDLGQIVGSYLDEEYPYDHPCLWE